METAFGLCPRVLKHILGHRSQNVPLCRLLRAEDLFILPVDESVYITAIGENSVGLSPVTKEARQRFYVDPSAWLRVIKVIPHDVAVVCWCPSSIKVSSTW
jgi:hypothetical protein